MKYYYYKKINNIAKYNIFFIEYCIYNKSIYSKTKII